MKFKLRDEWFSGRAGTKTVVHTGNDGEQRRIDFYVDENGCFELETKTELIYPFAKVIG